MRHYTEKRTYTRCWKLVWFVNPFTCLRGDPIIHLWLGQCPPTIETQLDINRPYNMKCLRLRLPQKQNYLFLNKRSHSPGGRSITFKSASNVIPSLGLRTNAYLAMERQVNNNLVKQFKHPRRVTELTLMTTGLRVSIATTILSRSIAVSWEWI